MKSKKQSIIIQKILLLLLVISCILIYSNGEFNKIYKKSEFYKECCTKEILIQGKNRKSRTKFCFKGENVNNINISKQIIYLSQVHKIELNKNLNKICNYNLIILESAKKPNYSYIEINLNKNDNKLNNVILTKNEDKELKETIKTLLKNIINNIKRIFTSINKEIIKNSVISWLCLAIITLCVVCICKIKKLF